VGGKVKRLLLIAAVVASLSLFGGESGAARNRVFGKVLGQVGESTAPLKGIRVYVFDASNREQDFTETADDGSFSIIVPVALPSFRLLFDDKSDKYWRKKEEWQNKSHPNDIGTRTLHSVEKRLTVVEVNEQIQLARMLASTDYEAAELLASRIGTEYADVLKSQSCGSLIPRDGTPALVLTAAESQASPTLLRSSLAANEMSAVGSIRTINTAQVTYASYYPEIGFADSLARLGPPPEGNSSGPEYAGLIDETLAKGQKSGYQFVLFTAHEQNASLRVVAVGSRASQRPNLTYEIRACPVAAGSTGRRYFYSNQTGEIRFGLDPLLTPNTTEPLSRQ
jgi:hypothetical protein